MSLSTRQHSLKKKNILKLVSCLATAALWSNWLPINQPPKNACLHRVLRQAKSSNHLYSMRCSLQSSIILLFTRQEVHIIGSKDRIVDDNFLCKKGLKVCKRRGYLRSKYLWQLICSLFSLCASLVCFFFFQSKIHFFIKYFVRLFEGNKCLSYEQPSTREHWRKWGMKSVVPGILHGNPWSLAYSRFISRTTVFA